jgi:hypothetical protein
MTNLEKYHEETSAWRDLKVKLKQFEVGNLVLLRSPRMENTGYQTLKEESWSTPGM